MASVRAEKLQLRERKVPFTAFDGMKLSLVHVRGLRDAEREPVLLVHGAGVRANIFRAPVQTSVVDALVSAGYDVWLENWRASTEVEPNKWTLDQAALYDHPAAVDTVLRETQAKRLKAVIHCQGSTSFTMSAVAGLLPAVDTIVSNAVSLHPLVPAWSRFKLNILVPFAKQFTQYLSPGWGVSAPSLVAKAILQVARTFHHSCHNDVCKLVSFTYGAGSPALWRHENLNDATHEWLKAEFGYVPLRFHSQMARCVAQGHLIAAEHLPGLPADFTFVPPKTEARFAFLAGALNRCFLPESQVRSHRYFSDIRPDFHSLHVFPQYSHLDIFMGQHAAEDIFPTIVDELARPTATSTRE